jgi:hypothetical protein
MVWFFERGTEKAVLEVRRQNTQFEFALRQADGNDHVEILPTAAALIARLEKVPDTLFVEGWRPVANAPQIF